MTYVAVNVEKQVYLRKSRKNWYATSDITTAYHHPEEQQIKRALHTLSLHGVSPGGWSVMTTGAASKLVPRKRRADVLLYCEELPQLVESSKYSTPATDEVSVLIEKIREIHLLTSSDAEKQLSAKLSQADKTISGIYHYIEVSNLNACQGYKAYKKLQSALIARRRIKNEIQVIRYVNQCGVKDISHIERLATKAWDPDEIVL